MKRWICIFLCAVLLLFFSGCGTSDKTAVESQLAESSEPETTGIGEIEHIDITEPLLRGEYIGRSADDAGFMAENVFINDDTMLGVDYVCFGDVKGSVMCYLKEGKIRSLNFGSGAFESQPEFNETIRGLNKRIAAVLEVPEAELKFTGQMSDGATDELEQVFQGGGMFSAEYHSGGCKITLNGLGVNAAATIVVEVQPIEGGE